MCNKVLTAADYLPDIKTILVNMPGRSSQRLVAECTKMFGHRASFYAGYIKLQALKPGSNKNTIRTDVIMHFFKKYVIKREQMPCPAAHDVLHEKPLLWNSMPFLSKLKFPDFGSQSELTRWHCDFCMTQQMTSQINRILHLRLHCIFLLINNCYIYIYQSPSLG